MQFSRAKTILSLMALSMVAGLPAMAQDSGFYIGANVGWSRSTIDNQRIATELWHGTFTSNSFSDRYSDTGYKVFGGYSFNKYFAIEAGYFDLGRFGFATNTVPAGTLVGDIKIQGVNADAVFTWPMTEQLSAFARIGANLAESRGTFNGTGLANILTSDAKKSETNFKFGLGLQFDFNKTVGIRGEVERYRISDAVSSSGDINLVSVGLLLRFGRASTYAPAPRAAMAPVYVAPAPLAPAVSETPAMVVAPVQERTQQYCTILDIQFNIDKDDIQREDKERLAVVGRFLTKYPDTTAVIEGHTDNVGTTEHNQKLSQHRAESVVTYLVDNLHIVSTRLTAVGYGELRPIADNRTEEGKRENRRIDAVITCATDVEGLTMPTARMTMAMLIEFDQNSAEVRAQYHEELRKVANFLKANPTVTATIEGHTGNLQGTPELAMQVSQHRAENVVTYLVDKFGIDRSRLTAEGFGKTQRFAYNSSVEGKQENRRVNIIINYPRNRNSNSAASFQKD